MKKILLITALTFGFVWTSNAQDISKNALGLRLGSNDGFGGEISYQRGLGDNNRLELDLGFRNSNNVDAFKIVGLYQWVWNIEGGLNWYAGVGGGVGSWSYNDNNIKNDGSFFLAAGDIGIEYNFQEAPIQLALDYRPEFYFNSDDYRNDNYGSDIALSIRYRFN
ncbi:hypothetical protein [Flavobacterium sp.]|uniref:hypothetical protein n=1 Tax=Flavobacterium sp. TaxID=239 RepID=UPI003F6950EA